MTPPLRGCLIGSRHTRKARVMGACRTWGDVGVEQRKKLKDMLQPYLDAMTGSSELPALPHVAMPPLTLREAPPSPDALLEVEPPPPEYRCHFADGSR